ncbi:MAG: deoxyribodipyrimidine photolyase, partial [Candidatus Eremiobacteraeota bacterium]|nr:deoxyribodipyrimidine photolyase [Candidatus Eremiobacteraeota bacterium]
SVELKADGIAEFLKGLKIDQSVKPVSQFFKGGTVQARTTFLRFIEDLLEDYDVQRNQPQTDYTSTMSPYLHYGMISPVYLSVTMLERCNPDSENVKSYLEELIIRRGLSQNFTHFEPKYDSFDCLPEWARKTLGEHAKDDRPDLLSRDELESASSHDPYWNAAQVEMVETGYMHNYMRMYWGKKILEWSASPREGYETTLYLNNKYFLDGRDPASFGNVAWIYGLHDRAWQERAIYGKIRTMTAGGLERKNDPKAYVEKIEKLTGRTVEGKDWLC